MIPGLNSKIRHAGVEYQVQTEDLGRQNRSVLTVVFHAGAVVAREKVNYLEVLGEGASEGQIKSLMEQQHQRVIRTLLKGQPAEAVVSHPKEERLADWAASLPDIARPQADKSLDQLILEYLQNRGASKPR
jgi:hypothetical protein